jgi:hypothetical protein
VKREVVNAKSSIIHQNGDTVIIPNRRLGKIGNTHSYSKTLLKVERFLLLSCEEDTVYVYTRNKVNYSGVISPSN